MATRGIPNKMAKWNKQHRMNFAHIVEPNHVDTHDCVGSNLSPANLVKVSM